MRSFLVIAAFALAAAPALATPAEESAGNGFVMMIHTTLEPRVLPGPPVGEAAVATRDGDSIVFHAIAFGVDTGRPALLREASLDVVGVDGSVLTVAANGAPEGRAVCVEETNLPGHEGDIASCLVFVVPASEFDLRNVVTLVLRAETPSGAAVTETYNALAHGLLHAWAEGAPVTLELADSVSQPTPVLVENVFDPVA